MQSGFGADDLDLIAKLALERCDKPLPSLGVYDAHPADMPGEVTLAEHVCEYPLIERRCKDVHGVARGAECSEEVLRDDQISHAQSREQDLAERSDIDDPISGIEALK